MNYKYLASLLVVILLLIGVTQGIVQSKLFQLKILVSRDRILNFELSSQALQKRFSSDFKKSDDYQTEINQSLFRSLHTKPECSRGARFKLFDFHRDCCGKLSPYYVSKASFSSLQGKGNTSYLEICLFHGAYPSSFYCF